MIPTLLRFRGLIWALTGRELKARYRGSLLGFFWSLVNPLLLLAVYTLVFDFIFRTRWGGAAEPYAVFLVTGLFPWIWFSSSLLDSTTALAGNAGLIRKAVFPIEVLPLVGVLAHLVHFLLALPITFAALGLARWGGGHPVGGASALLLPVALLLQLPFVAGLALALAALAVHFKDVRDLLQNLLTLLFFMTPIIYPLEGLPGVAGLRAVVAANPFTPQIRLYQELLFYGRVPGLGLWLQVAGLSVVVWALGALVFERLRDTLVEAV